MFGLGNTRETCPLPIARKIFNGLYIVLGLALVALAIVALVMYFENNEKGDIKQYQLSGITIGTIVATCYLLFQIISKLENVYKDKIRSKTLNEIHYMLARLSFDTDKKDPTRTIDKFKTTYMNKLCEDHLNVSTDARFDLLDGIARNSIINVSTAVEPATTANTTPVEPITTVEPF